MTEYYLEKLTLGLEYQDFVFGQLRKMSGMPIFLGAYASQKYQIEQGESLSGIEIKYDGKFKTTGNLYIEAEEKSRPEIDFFTPSGIMRDDNSWLYLIGDYEQAFIFDKNRLRNICERLKDPTCIKFSDSNLTSHGWLLSVNCVKKNKFYAKHVLFEGGETI